MTEKTIKQFFTPQSDRKRQRSYSSPESAAVCAMPVSSEKVGDWTRAELMDGLGQLLDSKLTVFEAKLESKLATKDDFSDLCARINVLEESNNKLKEEVSKLRAQEKATALKLVDLEARSRRNNLIFKGLKGVAQTKDYKHLVKQFCMDVLGSGDNIWINRAHPLGKDQNAIIAHIPDDAGIDYIMSRLYYLKGTGCVIHRDYPREVREKRSHLVAVRKEVERLCGRRRMPLVFDHLTIGKTRFTWEEGRLRAGQEDGGRVLSTMLKRDFSEFLDELQQKGPGGDRDRPPTPQAAATDPGSYAEATARGGQRTEINSINDEGVHNG